MIAVFYHIYQTHGWEDIFTEQRDLLVDSGLAQNFDLIHIGINGNEDIVPDLPNCKTIRNKNLRMEEADTLKSLRDFAKNNEAKILYMHTKGVSNPYNEEMRDWRKMMEYFCIEKWKECINILNNYDACGVNYTDECVYGFFPHFSGNFWWSTSEHIRKLNDSYLDHQSRFYREFWIGSNPNANLYELHNSGYAYHGHHRYPPERYREAI